MNSGWEVWIVALSTILLGLVSVYFLIPRKMKEEIESGLTIRINLGNTPQTIINNKGSMELFTFCLDSVIEEKITTGVMEQTFEVWQLIVNIVPNINTPKMEIREDTIMLDWADGEFHLMIHIIDTEWVNFFYIRHESESGALHETTKGSIPEWVGLYLTSWFKEK